MWTTRPKFSRFWTKLKIQKRKKGTAYIGGGKNRQKAGAGNGNVMHFQRGQQPMKKNYKRTLKKREDAKEWKKTRQTNKQDKQTNKQTRQTNKQDKQTNKTNKSHPSLSHFLKEENFAICVHFSCHTYIAGVFYSDIQLTTF
jgi:hypothetical protein